MGVELPTAVQNQKRGAAHSLEHLQHLLRVLGFSYYFCGLEFFFFFLLFFRAVFRCQHYHIEQHLQSFKSHRSRVTNGIRREQQQFLVFSKLTCPAARRRPFREAAAKYSSVFITVIVSAAASCRLRMYHNAVFFRLFLYDSFRKVPSAGRPTRRDPKRVGS